jgi:hypothetical protein
MRSSHTSLVVRSLRACFVVSILAFAASLAASCGGGLATCEGPNGAINCSDGKFCQWQTDGSVACVGSGSGDSTACGHVSCVKGNSSQGGCACLDANTSICRCSASGG